MNATSNQYYWPDLSAVIRQYVVVDDLGRFGIAHYNPYNDTLFARPIDTPPLVSFGGGKLMSNTAWHKVAEDTYTGIWYDYDGPSSTIPSSLKRTLTIIQDLGYLLPDSWADKILAESDQSGHWNYGATIGYIPGRPPVTGIMLNETTVHGAIDYAREAGISINDRTVRHAAKHGYIPGARKIGRDWLIPYDGFNHYLDHRPKPGRK